MQESLSSGVLKQELMVLLIQPGRSQNSTTGLWTWPKDKLLKARKTGCVDLWMPSTVQVNLVISKTINHTVSSSSSLIQEKSSGKVSLTKIISYKKKRWKTSSETKSQTWFKECQKLRWKKSTFNYINREQSKLLCLSKKWKNKRKRKFSCKPKQWDRVLERIVILRARIEGIPCKFWQLNLLIEAVWTLHQTCKISSRIHWEIQFTKGWQWQIEAIIHSSMSTRDLQSHRWIWDNLISMSKFKCNKFEVSIEKLY